MAHASRVRELRFQRLYTYLTGAAHPELPGSFPSSQCPASGTASPDACAPQHNEPLREICLIGPQRH